MRRHRSIIPKNRQIAHRSHRRYHPTQQGRCSDKICGFCGATSRSGAGFVGVADTAGWAARLVEGALRGDETGATGPPSSPLKKAKSDFGCHVHACRGHVFARIHMPTASVGMAPIFLQQAARRQDGFGSAAIYRRFSGRPLDVRPLSVGGRWMVDGFRLPIHHPPPPKPAFRATSFAARRRPAG
jgi:hypothetical protein